MTKKKNKKHAKLHEHKNIPLEYVTFNCCHIILFYKICSIFINISNQLIKFLLLLNSFVLCIRLRLISRKCNQVRSLVLTVALTFNIYQFQMLLIGYHFTFSPFVSLIIILSCFSLIVLMQL